MSINNVLDGDPASFSQKEQIPNFRPMSFVAKRLDGHSTSPKGGGAAECKLALACLTFANL